MAIKIKRKVNKPAEEEDVELTGDPLLDEPDVFFQTADKSVGWAADNQSLIIGAVGFVIVALLVSFFLIQNSRNNAIERSDSLTAALDVMSGTVGDDAAPNPNANNANIKRFSTSKAKYTELGAKADAVLSNHGGEDVAQLAGVMKARAAFGLGNYDEAITLYEGWLSANANSDEKPVVLQALAAAQAAGKKNDAAIATLEKLKALDADTYGEMASYQIGQIYEAAGQKDKAKAAYEELIKSYPDSKQLEYVKMRIDLM